MTLGLYTVDVSLLQFSNEIAALARHPVHRAAQLIFCTPYWNSTDWTTLYLEISNKHKTSSKSGQHSWAKQKQGQV